MYMDVLQGIFLGFFFYFFCDSTSFSYVKRQWSLSRVFFFKIAFYQYLLLEQLIGLGDQQKKSCLLKSE